MVNFELLSAIAMQLSQQNKSPKLASEAFKALSYLILDIHRNNIIEDITDIVAKAISTTKKRVQSELDVAAEQLVQAATESTDAGTQLIMDCQEVMTKIIGAAGSVASADVEGGSQRNAEQEGIREGAEEEGMTNTYADRVKRGIPTAHSMVIARTETQKRKIRLIKATGCSGEGMNQLSEKILVEKANLALVMMDEGEENRLDMMKFVAANKERGHGGVTYEMNSVEAADWIKEKTNMLNFLKNMGSTADYKEQTFDVVIDWTLASFEVEHHKGWRAVEQVSGLRNELIKDIAWIKPIHLDRGQP